VRPAINAGLSVSRVGGAAQTPIIKKLGGGVRLALAQYRELAAFSQFASDLDETTRKQLERGQRVVELLKQEQFSPLSVAEMAILLFSAEKGYLDDMPLKKIVDFAEALQQHVCAHHTALLQRINRECELSAEVESILNSIIEQFKQAWVI
jgi:F-type H+-transporting ATPase subunit alpha